MAAWLEQRTDGTPRPSATVLADGSAPTSQKVGRQFTSRAIAVPWLMGCLVAHGRKQSPEGRLGAADGSTMPTVPGGATCRPELSKPGLKPAPNCLPSSKVTSHATGNTIPGKTRKLPFAIQIERRTRSPTRDWDARHRAASSATHLDHAQKTMTQLTDPTPQIVGQRHRAGFAPTRPAKAITAVPCNGPSHRPRSLAQQHRRSSTGRIDRGSPSRGVPRSHDRRGFTKVHDRGLAGGSAPAFTRLKLQWRIDNETSLFGNQIAIARDCSSAS